VLRQVTGPSSKTYILFMAMSIRSRWFWD